MYLVNSKHLTNTVPKIPVFTAKVRYVHFMEEASQPQLKECLTKVKGQNADDLLLELREFFLLFKSSNKTVHRGGGGLLHISISHWFLINVLEMNIVGQKFG